ncbi:MAG: sulfatase-like hydrolase/transferase [Bacteroidales bacterium]|nr:sulfatase-like hydrolase/transferase [Bacteroidales bacterium]
MRNKEIPEELNIVIFLADDLGYGDLACYGNPIIKTPYLDRFSSEGVLLTDCHSGGTVCSPSRSALLTGRNPYRSGFYYILNSKTFLADSEVTIAELLKENGYETCFVGKWHLSVLEKDKFDHPDPGDQGFDYWMGTTHNAFDGPANTERFLRNGEKVGKVDGWYCDVIVEEAANWLKNIRDKDKPFFLYVASHEPHTPISPPAEYSLQYDTEEVDSLESLILYGGIKRPEKDLSEFKKEYYGTVSQLDDAFGRLMKTIDDIGARDNTLVIFTSDNGPETPVTIEESLGEWDDPIRDKCFGTPGIYKGMKRYPYEGGHRVPGLVRLPKIIPEGSTSNKLFNGTDILPTICQLTGIPLPEHVNIDGINNLNALLGKEPGKREIPAIWFYPNHEDTWFRLPQASMRSGNYSLIGWLPEKNDTERLNEWFFNSELERFELYDLDSDPEQSRNIADEKQEILSQMIPLIKKYWAEMRDEGRSN